MKPLLILAGLLFVANAVAGPTPTRNVVIFTELEKTWMEAVQKHDTQALDKILAPDYELRSGNAPGVPTPRDDSLKQSLQAPAFQSSIGQMAVHEYGDLMVVSFMWKIAAPKGAGLAQNVFVVDTWKRAGDSWQVLVRYASPVDTAATVPGAVPPSPESLRKKI
jgi:ketosteroid isomerase-like protein